MSLLSVTSTVLLALDEGPAPEDVKAGWGAFGIFLLLALAVALLGWSLTRHLRTAERAKDAGVFGDEPATQPESADRREADGE